MTKTGACVGAAGVATLLAAGVATLILAGLWFAAGGFAGRPRPPSWLTARPFAHRGDHRDASHPENSLAAFRAAADAGFGIELDVRLTRDRHAVVFHDDSLERMTRDVRRLSDVTLAELRSLRLGGTDEQVPTLREALDVVRGRVPLLVEVKHWGAPGTLEEAVATELTGYGGPVAVISFEPRSLARLATLAPHLARGQLSGLYRHHGLPGWHAFMLRHLLLCAVSRPDFIVYELAGLPSWPTRLQRALGRPLLAYTPETRADTERASSVADAYICNPGALPRGSTPAGGTALARP